VFEYGTNDARFTQIINSVRANALYAEEGDSVKTRRSIRIGILLALVTFVALSPAGLGQSSVEPDLKVGQEDISFNPPSPVRYTTSVTISANIHNLGICYIALGDNSDQVEYSFTTSSLINWFRIKARIRSSNGDTVIVNVWVDEIDLGLIGSSSTSWSEQLWTGATSITTGGHYLKVMLLSGGDSNTDMDIDWIELTNYDGSVVLFHFEAENYDLHYNSVDEIHPQQVTVRFYQGASGPQIGSATVGDAERATETGTVKILRKDASATASMTWAQPLPLGTWDIWCKVQPDPKEESTHLSNNEAYRQIVVFSSVGGVAIPIDRFGLLAPYFGLAATIIAVTAATTIYVKHVKRRKEKQ